MLLDPLTFVGRLASLVARPGFHRTRYHGVFAPNHPWRADVVPPPPRPPQEKATGACAHPARGKRWTPWAQLLARVLSVEGLGCPSCGTQMQVHAVVLGRAIARVLGSLSRALETVSGDLEDGTNDQDFVTAVAYNEKGQRTSITYGSGGTTAYTYDPNTFRLATLVSTLSGDKLQDLTYTYDAVGNVVEVADASKREIYFNTASAPTDSGRASLHRPWTVLRRAPGTSGCRVLLQTQ